MKAVRNTTTNVEESPNIKLFYGEILIEEGSNFIRNEIFDGVELKVELVTISVFVTISKTHTVQISPVSYIYRLISTNAILCNCD